VAVDFTTDVGRVRLRVGDASDLPLLPDIVYTQTITDCNGYLPRAAVTICQYILGMLTCSVHEKLSQIEVFGADYFNNYMAFVKATILNPATFDISPLPYTPPIVDEWGNTILAPLLQFQKDWTENYAYGTQSQQMRWTSYPAGFGWGQPQNFF